MKKMWFAVAAMTLMMAGCCQRSDEVEHLHDNTRIVNTIEISHEFDIFCDRKTNIAYLRWWGTNHKGGITVYVNADGKPARCNEVPR